MSDFTKISVVVPVYNEHDNIGACLLGLWNALSGVPHEILVCYDFDEDTTLAAIASMPDRPPTLRLVKNTIGRGAANALRAGFAAATGDVVVTTMADLSDPPQDILRMAELMRRGGLAVVAGSRYMRGGSQSGGPRLKRTLSRLGGLSLRWIAGLGTSDATSNFRAYSKSFLERVEIESSTGFEIALELTVKAHAAGLGVGEVPTSWTDRTAGESRFRLWRWLPSYARWWLRAAWQPLVVGLVWMVMTVGAWTLVDRHAARMPMWDDLELVPFVGPDSQWSLREMWSQHNEHRLPLPRLIETALFDATGDVRALMYAQVLVLAGLALVTLLVVRRIRGRTLLCDALFPLLWLHTGNAENLLMGFQLALVLAVVFTCAVVLVMIVRPRRGVTPGEALLAGACLLGLPACGALGLVQVPVLLAGLALAAWWSWRTREPQLRRGAVLLALLLTATCAFAALYFVGLRYPHESHSVRDPVRIAGTALRVLTLGLGQAGKAWWPWSGVGACALLAATLALLIRGWRSSPGERIRVIALVCGMGASIGLALAIGYGRGRGGVEAGFEIRYTPLVSPLVVAAACAWVLYGGRIAGWVVPGTLALALLAANALVNVPAGHRYGAARMEMEHAVEQDLAGGIEPRAFVERWTGRVYPDRGRLRDILARLARLRIAPFDRVAQRTRERFAHPVSNLEPARIESPDSPVERYVDEWWPALLVPDGCVLHYEVPPGTTRLSGKFGMLDRAVERGAARGMRAVVSASTTPGPEREILLDRELDPVQQPADRGPQAFDVRLPAGTRHVALEVLMPPDAEGGARWAYWGDLFFE